MSTPDDLMPAFPVTDGGRLLAQGMDLRDYFAAHAIDAAYAQCSSGPGELRTGWGAIAQIAYVIADHMLAARFA